MRLLFVATLALACTGAPDPVVEPTTAAPSQADAAPDPKELPKSERPRPSQEQIEAAREYLAQRSGRTGPSPSAAPAPAAPGSAGERSPESRLIDAEMAAKAEADCKAGTDARACVIAAGAYDPSTTPRVRPANPARSIELARRGCELGDAGACAIAGSMLVHGSIGTLEERRGGIDLLLRACELGHGTGCLMAATVLGTDRLGPGDTAKAVELAIKACDHGHAEGCFLVAAALEGDGAQTERRLSFYEKGCELGSDKACSNLAILLHNGEGVPRDLERARAIAEGACAKKLGASCLLHGTFLMEGIGGPKDPAGARVSLTIACEDGSVRACGMLKE